MTLFRATFVSIGASLLLSLSSCGSISDQTVVIGAPSQLKTQVADRRVTVSWQAMQNAQSYALFWSMSPGVTESNEYFTVNETSYTHTGLTNYTTYYYRLGTISSTGNIGDLSDEVSATPKPTLPLTPEGLTATAGNSAVMLSWNAAERATSYKIYWNTTGSVTENDTSFASGETSATHTGLTNGTTYYYRVAGVNQDGEGDLSGEVSATPVQGATGGCIGEHTPPAGLSVAITISRCTPKKSYTFIRELEGYNLTRGRLGFRMTGVGDTNVPNGAIFLLMYGEDSAGNRENAHMMLWGSGSNKNVRLVRHYWNPDLSAKFHQKTFSFHPSVTYTWDCWWDASDFSCNITGSDGSKSITFSVPWVAPFAKIAHTGFQVGSGVYNRRTIGANPQVSAVRYTVFK